MVWVDIAMDILEGFPRLNGKSMIITVVDWLSNSAHFIPIGHPYTAMLVTRAFFDTVVWLHGIPSSIVSDRDVMFTSHFWSELFALAGIKLNLSSGAKLWLGVDFFKISDKLLFIMKLIPAAQ
jgi:hypothetical protein